MLNDPSGHNLHTFHGRNNSLNLNSDSFMHSLPQSNLGQISQTTKQSRSPLRLNAQSNGGTSAGGFNTLENSERNLKMPSIKQKKTIFDSSVKRFGLKRPTIQMPDSYVNGLPDLFQHYKKARENFTWFKKQRKSHRDQDLLKLRPEPYFHKETKPQDQPLNLFFEKVKSKTMLKDFNHDVITESRHRKKKQSMAVAASSSPFERFQSPIALRDKANRSELPPSKEIFVNKNNLGFGPTHTSHIQLGEGEWVSNSHVSSGRQLEMTSPNVNKIEVSFPDQEILDKELSKYDLRKGKTTLGGKFLSTQENEITSGSDPKDEKVFYNSQGGSDMQDIMRMTSQRTITDYKVITTRSPADPSGKKAVQIKLMDRPNKILSVKELRQGFNVPIQEYQRDLVPFMITKTQLSPNPSEGKDVKLTFSPSQKKFLNKIKTNVESGDLGQLWARDNHLPLVSNRRFQTLDSELNEVIQRSQYSKNFLSKGGNTETMEVHPLQMNTSQGSNIFWPQGNKPITTYEKHKVKKFKSPDSKDALEAQKQLKEVESPEVREELDESTIDIILNQSPKPLLHPMPRRRSPGFDSSSQSHYKTQEIESQSSSRPAVVKKKKGPVLNIRKVNKRDDREGVSSLHMGGENNDLGTEEDDSRLYNSYKVAPNMRADPSHIIVPPNKAAQASPTRKTMNKFSPKTTILSFNHIAPQQRTSRALAYTLGSMNKASPSTLHNQSRSHVSSPLSPKGGSMGTTSSRSLHQPKKGMEARYTPEKNFVLQMPFKNYLSSQMQKTYMNKVKQIQDSTRSKHNVNQQTSIGPSQLSFISQKNSNEPSQQMFGLKLADRIVEKTLGEGGTLSQESIKNVPGPKGETISLKTQQTFLDSMIDEVKQMEIDMTKQDRHDKQQDSTVEANSKHDQTQTRIVPELTKAHSIPEKHNLPTVPDEANPDDAIQLAPSYKDLKHATHAQGLIQDGTATNQGPQISDSKQTNASPLQQMPFKQPVITNKTRDHNPFGRAEVRAVSLEKPEKSPKVKIDENSTSYLKQKIDKVMLPNGSIIHCTLFVKRILDIVIEGMDADGGGGGGKKMIKGQPPNTTMKPGVLWKTGMLRTGGIFRTGVKQFLRTAQLVKSDLELPYERIMLPNEQEVTKIEDIAGYEKYNTLICLILLKKDQTFARNSTKLQEIALDSLQQKFIQARDQSYQVRLMEQQQLIDKINWIQEGLKALEHETTPSQINITSWRGGQGDNMSISTENIQASKSSKYQQPDVRLLAESQHQHNLQYIENPTKDTELLVNATFDAATPLQAKQQTINTSTAVQEQDASPFTPIRMPVNSGNDSQQNFKESFNSQKQKLSIEGDKAPSSSRPSKNGQPIGRKNRGTPHEVKKSPLKPQLEAGEASLDGTRELKNSHEGLRGNSTKKMLKALRNDSTLQFIQNIDISNYNEESYNITFNEEHMPIPHSNELIHLGAKLAASGGGTASFDEINGGKKQSSPINFQDQQEDELQQATTTPGLQRQITFNEKQTESMKDLKQARATDGRLIMRESGLEFERVSSSFRDSVQLYHNTEGLFQSVNEINNKDPPTKVSVLNGRKYLGYIKGELQKLKDDPPADKGYEVKKMIELNEKVLRNQKKLLYQQLMITKTSGPTTKSMHEESNQAPSQAISIDNQEINQDSSNFEIFVKDMPPGITNNQLALAMSNELTEKTIFVNQESREGTVPRSQMNSNYEFDDDEDNSLRPQVASMNQDIEFSTSPRSNNMSPVTAMVGNSALQNVHPIIDLQVGHSGQPSSMLVRGSETNEQSAEIPHQMSPRNLSPAPAGIIGGAGSVGGTASGNSPSLEISKLGRVPMPLYMQPPRVPFVEEKHNEQAHLSQGILQSMKNTSQILQKRKSLNSNNKNYLLF